MDLDPMAYPKPKPILTSKSWDGNGDGDGDGNSSLGSDSSDTTFGSPHKPLAVLSDHTGSISSLALCGEFLLSASNGKDIIVWQQPDLRPFARFGHSSSDGSVKSLITVGIHVFTAHQDGKIRVWKVSSRLVTSSENIFKLTATLPTRKDYLRNFMKQSNYVVHTRRNRRPLLWIQHADSISCLAVSDGIVYSGSWDKTFKVWRVSDFKCLENIKAHDDAINAVAASGGIVYTASADATIKAWARDGGDRHCLKGCLEGCPRSNVAWNSVIVCEDGRLVYGGGSDGRVMGWAVDRGSYTWRLVCNLKSHDLAVLCLCSRGEFMCTGSADKSIGVWRREEGGSLCRVGTIRGHEGPVKCLQASDASMGGGFMLYSGGLDKRLRVWWVPKDYGEENGQLMEKCLLLS